MNITKLKGKIVGKGMNVEMLAERIGVNRSSMYRKLNDSEKISIAEAIRIKEVLELTDEEATEIFFA